MSNKEYNRDEHFDVEEDLFNKMKSFTLHKGASLPMEQYYINADIIFRFFLDVRFSAAQAAGMVAQADAEASLDPTAVGDAGKAFGLFQLHADRAALVCNGNKQYPGCGVNVQTLPSVSAQLEAIWHELRHSEKHALSEILATQTAYDAGFAACLYYERSGIKTQAAKRGAKAETWLKYFAETTNEVKLIDQGQTVGEDTSNSAIVANTAGANNTTLITSANTGTDVDTNVRKDSIVARANNDNKHTFWTSNTDPADSINENISNVNFFDPEIAKKPDETTYLDTPTTSNTAHLDRSLKLEDVLDVAVFDTKTVNTATSTISANTVKNYANVSQSNTVVYTSEDPEDQIDRNELSGESNQEILDELNGKVKKSTSAPKKRLDTDPVIDTGMVGNEDVERNVPDEVADEVKNSDDKDLKDSNSKGQSNTVVQSNTSTQSASVANNTTTSNVVSNTVSSNTN